MTTKNTAINTAINTARRGPDPIRARGLTLAWGGVDSRPIRRWRGLFAALLIVLGAAVAAPEQAAAQTETTFLSNTGQALAFGSNNLRATRFTTGAGTYTLSSVGIDIGTLPSPAPTPLVQIYGHSGTGVGAPGTLLATMTNPATLVSNAVNVFTAPANTTLSANTNYWVVTSNSAATDGTGFRVSTTSSSALDSGTAAGWLGGSALFKNASAESWGGSTGRHRYQIRGTAQTTTPTPTNAAPVFADTTLTRSIAENTAANVNVGAVIPAATDTDSGDTLTYSMEGTDAAEFNFNATTRQITTKAGVTYDFEAKSSYSVTIKVSDQTDSDTATVTIDLTDVDEPPSAPAAPTVAATSGSTTSLDVSWTAPANSGKPAITSYDLQYRAGTSGSFTDGPQNVTGTSTAIASLNSGTSYQVQVRATNDEGDSGWSGSGSGSTSTVTPMMTGGTTFISNTGQTASTNTNQVRATAFTTGAGTYTLSSVAISVSSHTGTPTPVVQIYRNNSGTPGTLVATMTNPDPLVNSVVNVFTDTANTTLTASTTYWLVTSNSSSGGAGFRVTVRSDTNLDSGTAAGWSIGNALWRAVNTNPWDSSNNRIQFQIRGTAQTTTPTPTNAAPVFADTTLTRSIAENTAANVNVGAVIPAATDTDTGDTLTYSMEGTDAASFNFNATTRQITTKTGVTYDFEAKSSYSVTIKVSDETDTDTVAVTITLTDVNEPPSAPGAPTVAATSGSTTSLDVSWTAPANSGKPAIASYDLQYRAGSSGSFTDGPQDVTGTSTAIASLNAGTSYQVQVRATNDEGDSGWSGSGSGSTSTTTPTNNVPVVENPIPDQTAPVGGGFSYAFPPNTFSDADSDTLSYTATKPDDTTLPTWLSLNSRTFSGTPAASDVGVVSVKVTASDGKGGTVSDDFDITVELDTTPPTLSSATVNPSGGGITLVFSETVSGSSSVGPPDLRV